MKYSLTFIVLLIFILTSTQVGAVVTPTKTNTNNVEEIQKTTPERQANYSTKEFKKVVRKHKRFKKNKKRSWLKNFFKKNKGPETKNKGLRIFKKIFLWSVLVFIPTFILGIAGLSNEHTFIGSMTYVFLGVSGIASYAGLISLLLIIILGIRSLVNRD